MVVHSIHLPLEAKVGQVIMNGRWNNTITNLLESNIKSKILATPINHLLDKDETIQTANLPVSSQANRPMLVCVSKGTKLDGVALCGEVGSSPSIAPWHGKFARTHSKPKTDSKYKLCDLHNENSRHLYFNCQYSKAVWGKIKHEIGLSPQVETSEREWNFILRLCKGGIASKEIYKVILCSTLYNIWHERNNRVFNKKSCPATKLAMEIIRKVRKHLNLVLKVVSDSTQFRIICGYLKLTS